MAKRKSKKKEVKSKQTGTVEYEVKNPFPIEPAFVPDDVKVERIRKGLKQERIKKDKVALDFWLRHTLGLGTKQIKQLWKKLDEIYKE